jgi:drug/metabolite transporter (DMT)-like permease
MATERSTPSLFGDVIWQITDLFRTELRLFRAEMDEKVSTAARAVGFIAVAAVLLLAALFLILSAAVDALVAFGMPRYWAALLVGGVVGIIGVILLLKALSDLKPSNLKPSRSIHQIGKDVVVAKAQVK